MRFALALASFLVSTTASAIGPFSMPWVNNGVAGTFYNSAAHPNGVFVLEFLANFCPACNQNAANVDELAAAYADRPRVQVLDIATDSSDREIAAWIRNHSPNHPVLKDVGRTLWTQVGERYIPTVVVTDCHGTIRYQFTDVWTDAVKAEIRAVVDTLLTESCG